jgi:hypothetical protein
MVTEQINLLNDQSDCSGLIFSEHGNNKIIMIKFTI